MKDYLLRVLKFAFRGFAIRTDVWYAVISIAVSALTGGADKPVTEITTHDIAWYFLIALGVYMALRLLAAPYYLWKEDQKEIADLKEELDRPDRREAEAGLEHRIALRAELGERLAKLVTMAEISATPGMFQSTYGHRGHELGETNSRIGEIVSLLSYDVALRVTVINLKHLCWRIIAKAGKGEPVHAEIERLWAQRKLTFRLLNRDDEVNDLITMVEIENLIEPYGESFESTNEIDEKDRSEIEEANDVMRDVRRMVKELGPKVRLIGRQPNLTSANRGEALDKKDGGKLSPR